MTQTDDSTMAASEATDTVFKKVECKNKSKWLKTTPVQKIPVQRTHNYTIHACFPQLHANAKFNLSSNMHQLLMEMLKYDSTIMIINLHDKAQLQLATDKVPMTEAEFTKYFTVNRQNTPNQHEATYHHWMPSHEQEDHLQYQIWHHAHDKAPWLAHPTQDLYWIQLLQFYEDIDHWIPHQAAPLAYQLHKP